jgi:hypothetical protein
MVLVGELVNYKLTKSSSLVSLEQNMQMWLIVMGKC